MNHSPINDLSTVLDWVRWSSSEFRRAELFYGHGTENDWEEALLFVLWAIQQPWERLDQLWQAALTAEEKARLFDAVSQRIERRCPAAYLTGEAWFAGLRFAVNEHVLVPRSPFAELIANGFQPWLKSEPQHILDLCTGSGCIGIACAYAFDEARVDLSDISAEAVAVAEQNIALHGLSDRVTVTESDGFQNLEGRQYDLIVSNPPYVSEAEYAALPEEYLREPKLGLTSGDDGFDFVEMLLARAADFLSEDGLLLVEVGHGWQACEARFPQYPFFWPEFEHGGCGIFILSREQLLAASQR